VVIVEKGLQTWYATIVGAVLLLVGILGFFSAPVLGLFDVNALHNVVHLITGAVFLWAGVWGGMAAAQGTNRWLGIIYLVVAVLGFLGFASFLAVNGADNWLHLLLGVVSAGISWAK
jgi:hypothetical protein